MSDEELVVFCKQKNQDAIAVLYIRFKGLIYSITFDYLRKRNIAQMYRDDLIDLATDALFKAIDTYDDEEGSSFRNFWWTIALRYFSTYFKKLVSSKLFSFEPNFFDTYYGYLNDSKHKEKAITAVIVIENIIKKNKNLFLKEENDVLHFYFLGYTTKEIADELGIPVQRVYRIKSKALAKLNKIIKSN